MGTYCQAVGFMKIKPELIELFQKSIDDEIESRCLYATVGIDFPEYDDWFMNVDGGAQHYIDFDFECGIKDDYLIFSGSRARAHGFIESIKNTIQHFSESYIVITLDEEDYSDYITKNIEDMPLEYRYFYETFVIDRNKIEEPCGYSYAYAQYLKSL